MTTEKRLEERCIALEKLIDAIKPFYNKTDSDNQKAFIETIVGAAIWYLPHGKNYWNNKVSKKAIEKLRNDFEQRLTRDHVFPRKESAKRLLTKDLGLDGTGAVLRKLYKEKFGVYVLVTPEENRKLIKIQREHNYGHWEEAYKEAQIELEDFEDMFESEDSEFIHVFKKKI